ncbi:S-adenosyl-L-methionine-dependent methyltransferase [Mycena polygramma]|nr:S-adenosyl-L-methionine-dependent methyltransferase [Mycena polygramma]
MVNGRRIPYVLVPAYASPRKRHGQVMDYVEVPWIRKRKASPTPSSSTYVNPSPKNRRRRDEDANLPSSVESSPESEEIVYTEEQLADDDDTSGWDEQIPTRILADFRVFEGEESDLVEATELLGDTSRLTASGRARPHYVDSTVEDEDDEDGQLVTGLQILECNVHHIWPNGTVDPHIYIRTPRAWYILNTPASIYRPFFVPLWIRHRFTHLIVSSSIRDPTTTYQDFVDSLPAPLTECQLKSAEIAEYFDSYLAAISDELKRSKKRGIRKVPLIKTIQGNKFSEHLEIPKALVEVKAFVTPIVARVVMPHIRCPMTVVGSDVAESDTISANQYSADPHEFEHDDSDPTVDWGPPTGPGFYESAEIDGVLYQRGDIVSVNRGHDEDIQRAERAILSADFCRNSYARRVWFIRIEYFFDNKNGDPTKKLHGIWFTHGCDTILGEVNHSKELFMTKLCDDIDISSIYRKCNVKMLGLEEVEYPDNGDDNSNSYFTRGLWDEDKCEFRDPPTVEEERRANGALLLNMPCVMCGFEAEEREYRKLRRLVPNGFTQYGQSYHKNDFAYVKPDTASSESHPLLIGRITDIKWLPGKVRCSINYFKRWTTDHRRLYRTRHTNEVDVKDLDGVCFVKFIDHANVVAIEKWIQEDSNNFYANTRMLKGGDVVPMEEDDFKVCGSCERMHEQEAEEMKLYPLRKGKISCMDVFSGAGGLSEGMRKTPHLKHEWAIEHLDSAAETYAVNHSGSKVFCVDVNDFLRYIAEREEGKDPSPLRSSDGSIIPDKDIPRPGEVGLVSGGSPCQSFSGANFRRKEDDIRSTLPFTLISLLEVLQPTYFLLENVTGLMSHTLTGGTKRVEMATVKLIYRSLLALGYQVRFKVLQAGQYGAPQDRERVIFLAAKRGHKLPDFPVPTHAFSRSAKKWKIPLRKRDRIVPPSYSRTDEDHLYAPHPTVTIDDAIDDLPRFEWVNPHIHIPETPRDREERRKREQDGIVQCIVSGAPVGFLGPVPFKKEPRTRYQKAMRRPDGLVDQHVTRRCSKQVVESTTLIPLKAWSNHRFLPDELVTNAMRQFGNKDISYGRLDGTSYFMTALTAPKPYAKNTHFLHPSQKRTLSLREFARSQGFPDRLSLLLDKIRPARPAHRWNAVPIPLATALGRSIGAAVVEDWRNKNPQNRRQASVEC